jgi:hypothetical protein
LTFGSINNNNNHLWLGSIPNNEASVLESLFQIFGMAGRYFSEIFTNVKIINLCLTSLDTRVL